MHLTHYTEGDVARTWVDRKRALWLFSPSYALFPLFGIALHALTGYELLLVLPVFISYFVLPLVDAVVGEDQTNPPEAAVKALEADGFYARLPMLTVPLHFVSLTAALWWASTATTTSWAFWALAVTAGLASGLAINTAHELGHKNTNIERVLARLALAVPGYGHFTIEHNQGHHSEVATPDDPASARMGESIFRFATREIPGGVRRGLKAEADRLERLGLPFWSVGNHILQSYAVTILFQGALVAVFGWSALGFLLVHNAVAWWQLTSANYIEHYGLLRTRLANGRRERCQPHHSWNSNHLCSNLMLFHLQRHSDHHSHPRRRYQSLRHFATVPALPSGYFGMYLLAYVPPLWFRVMDKRLLALPHISGDLDKVNIQPAAEAKIRARYS